MLEVSIFWAVVALVFMFMAGAIASPLAMWFLIGYYDRKTERKENVSDSNQTG